MLVGFSEEYLLTMAVAWIGLALSLIALIVARPWRARSTVGRLFARGSLLVWSLFLVAVGLESAFALLYDTTDSFGLVKTSTRWTERHVALNNWEYRDAKRFSAARRPGVTRIALVGDSFTFGHGVAEVSDRFGDLLESQLNQAAPGQWEIYNLARPGDSTDTEIKNLRELKANGFQTDVVLLVYCPNDIETLTPGNDIVIGTILLDYPSNLLFREAYLPNFLYYRYRQFQRPEVRSYFGWLRDAYRGETWDRQKARLDEFREVCREMDAELWVALFPFLHQLGAEYDFEYAHDALAEYFRAHDVPVVDLLEPLRAATDGGLVVNRYDAHPNERAHAIAADAIWTGLIKPQLDKQR